MAAYSTIDLRSCCRVCLEEPHMVQMLDMNTIYDKDAKLSFYDCYEICAKHDLRLCCVYEPNTLCKRCGVELQWAYDFYRKVAQSNQQLQDLCSLLRSGTDVGTKNLESLSTQLAGPDNKDFTEVEAVQHVIGDEVFQKKHLESKLTSVPSSEGETSATYEIKIVNIETFDATSSNSDTDGYDHKQTVNADNITPRRRHTGQHICQFCQKPFRNNSRMMKHQLTHLSDRPQYICNHCDRIYLTKPALRVHVETIHNQSGHKCAICGKIFVVRKSLEIHMRYHTGNFPFQCDQCDRKFAQCSHLNVHRQVKHSSARFICSFNCGKYFTSSSSLRNHEYTHTSMPFECNFCETGFPARAKLRAHIKVKHGELMTLEQLERMRKFHVARSKLLMATVENPKDEPSTL